MKKEFIGISTFILRIGLAIVFLYFGLDKFINLEANINIIKSIGFIPINIKFFTIFFSVIEILVASFLILGLFTRITAIVASLMILTIFLTFWFLFNDLIIRDIGLLAAAVSLAITGSDVISIDKIIKNTRIINS